MFFEFLKKIKVIKPILAPRLGNEKIKPFHFSRLMSLIKIKTLLIVAGFLVPICFAGLIFGLYEYFLVSHDVFFDDAPAESAIYWHSSFPEGADDLWLQTFSKKLVKLKY